MWSGHVKLAVQSIKSTKWRSFLTMLGIIIGVVSVITIVSLGEGVKRQVSSQVSHFGSDLITIRPGRMINRDQNGKLIGINFFANNGTSVLSEKDYTAIAKNPGLRATAPFSFVSGIPSYEGHPFDKGMVIATSHQIPELINQKITYGDFFTADQDGQNEAVLGQTVAEQLFRENVPIGKSFDFHGRPFVVRGIFQKFAGDPLGLDIDFNNVIFIPYQTGKAITSDTPQIFQILAKPTDIKQTDQTMAGIQKALLTSHGGQQDFTILKQGETVGVTNNVVTLLTTMVAGIAAISLLVGGIGVMNIMIVAVTERTHEIGIRKAIGATNRQILGQFLIEAIILSIAGGVLGVIASLIVNALIQIFTSIHPVITLPVVVISLGVSVLVGVIFGVMPAVRAARMDPIDALRRE